MKRVLVALLTLTALATSCKKDSQEKNIFKGPEVQLHNGKAWTWVQLKKDGSPERLGITINDKAMNSMPGPDGNGDGGHGHDPNNHIILQFHPKAAATLFKHVWLNWNPNGHEPSGIYDLPHFDIHYYMTTVEEREAMLDNDKMNNIPAADYVPANYIAPMPGVPTMGNHLIDTTSPELNGQPFTQTFILGSYDGRIIFYEPMITKAFLLANANYERPVPQPAKFQTTGYYPTKMRVVKHDGVTEIILDGFVYRQAS